MNFKDKQYVQTIGYGGPAPLAIIFWKLSQDEPAVYKSICYDEQDVINMYKRHTTPGDIYSTLIPSIHMADGKEPVQQVA